MPALRLTGIEKVFPGGQVAVAGVDLAVEEGELVVLLGPSGCGKSTLLRIVAGIETPSSGQVWIADQDVTAVPPQQRDIAMVFQNYALYPHMSVRDNLAFGLRMRRLAQGDVQRRVDEVAVTLGLEALLARKPAQLSGGQRQRVALGRAIARKAKVFLLDEPLSNLDAQLRVHTRMEIARLHQSLRVPMLYVTHDQEEAMTLGDRIAVMRAGRVLQLGSPLEIYDRPATRFVGGFVGSPQMNFLTGRWEGAAGRDVTVGIRPEHVELLPAGTGELQARVEVVEPLGREVLMHVVRTGDAGGAATLAPGLVVTSRTEGTPLSDAPHANGDTLRVLVPGTVGTAPGTKVGLRLKRERLHLFDSTSEVRLAVTL